MLSQGFNILVKTLALKIRDSESSGHVHATGVATLRMPKVLIYVRAASALGNVSRLIRNSNVTRLARPFDNVDAPALI